MISKKSKVLFFIVGPVPTEADKAAAAAIENKTIRVMFRNASAIGDGDAVESCDGLAGKIPALYRSRLPDVKVYGEDSAPAKPAVPAPVSVPTPAAPAPVVATIPAAPVVPASESTPTPAPQPDAAAQQRAAEDEGAKNATAAQLKEALKGLGIKFASNANKAELLALFLNR